MMRLYAPAGIQTGEQDAANAAAALEMPFFVYDMQKDFQKWVIQDFINVYRSGGTPTPRITCNRTMKFGAFLDQARQAGYEKSPQGTMRKSHMKTGGMYYTRRMILQRIRAMCSGR